MSNNTTATNWFYELLRDVQDAYRPHHLYVTIAICIAGILCNCVTIIVFSRPALRSPVNSMLIAIAACDTMVLISSLANTLPSTAAHSCDPADHAVLYPIIVIVHAQLSMIFRSSSIWLSVCLALLRVIILRNPRSLKISNQSLAYLFIILTIGAIVVLNVPNCLLYRIEVMPVSELVQHCKQTKNITVEDTGGFVYRMAMSELATKWNSIILRVAYWIPGIMFKAVPCTLLCVLVMYLLRILAKADERHQRLVKTAGTSRKRHSVRTTRMLTVIVLLALCMEMPVAIMTILSGISIKFRFHVYEKVGDFIDLLSLVNSLATFIIYCSMSTQYRQVLCSYLPKPKSRMPDSTANMNGSTRKDNNNTAMTPLMQGAALNKSASGELAPSRCSSVSNYCSTLVTHDKRRGATEDRRPGIVTQLSVQPAAEADNDDGISQLSEALQTGRTDQTVVITYCTSTTL